MPFCLPQKEAQKIKDAIVSGQLNPEKLNNMTSANRRKFLAELVGGDNAKKVNLLFEQKLLLKNQEKAITDWARDITGLSKESKEATLKRIRETYAEKKRRVLEPKENEIFLNEIVSDIYSKKTGANITLEEAQVITDLSSDLAKSRAKMNDDFSFDSKKNALKFGASKVAFDNYIGNLKTEAQKRPLVNPFSQKGSKIIKAIGEDVGIAANFIADNSRAMVASFDNSFWGRQGLKVALNPRFAKQWAKNFAKSFVDIYKVLRKGPAAGDAIVDAVKAEIYSRPNYLKGRYELGKKLDIGTGEEEFPTSAPSKIPFLGRVFKAAEIAYTAGAMRLRVDVADKIYKMAEKNGIDLTDKKATGDINLLVNSMTGRGRLGRLEAVAPAVNKAFFSIKKVKSDIDFLTDWAKTDKHPFARKLAAQNLLMVASSIATILGIANTLDPKSVEEDSRSSDFGKIRKGDTRFDMTGGMSALLILATRIAKQSTKRTTTGEVRKLGEKFGDPSGMDVIWQFTENKFSPAFSVIKELIDQETFEGDVPTLLEEAKNLTVPIILEEAADAKKNEQSANLLLILIAEALGISANTFSADVSWSRNPSAELERFKKRIGDSKFKEANNEFNKNMREWLAEIQKTGEYKNLSAEEKSKRVTRQRRIEKKKIFRKYTR